MAAIKYDVSDVESGGGGEEPQPALYAGKIVSMTKRSKLADGKSPVSDLEVVVDVGAQYSRLWTYVKLPDDPNYNKEAHGWKLRELTDALGLPPKGSIDPVKVSKEQPAVGVKVTADTHRDTGDYRGRIKNLFPPSGEAAAEPEEAASGSSDEGPYPREEIETWEDDDIKGYAEEIGADGPTSGRGWKSKLIDAIISQQDEGAGDPEADGPADNPALEGIDQEFLDELNEDPTYYATWTDDDFKWMLEGLGIDGNVATSGRGWKAKAIAAIVEVATGGGEATAADESETTEEPAAEVPDDYDDLDDAGAPVWSDADFKAEIAERNEQGAEIKLAGRPTREKLIAALRADNASGEPF